MTRVTFDVCDPAVMDVLDVLVENGEERNHVRVGTGRVVFGRMAKSNLGIRVDANVDCWFMGNDPDERPEDGDVLGCSAAYVGDA